MKTFMDKDFLLNSETAVYLYHNHAKKMPIADYHCHIDPKDIWEDKKFNNITEVWLSGDHYKWRIMRSNGIDEHYITGDATPREKFQKFSETLPKCIGNPMYHWCHLELKNYFGYNGVLNGETAEEVWNLCNKKLEKLTARQLILDSGVSMIGTTDDPLSDLCYHELLEKSDFPVKVCPSFRPDPALNIHKPGFSEYIKKLSEVTGIDIKTVSQVKKALSERMEYFKLHGCRASDHGLDYIMCRLADEDEIEAVFQKALDGEILTKEECEIYQTDILLHCGKEYKRLGFVMQLHFSCKRNPNSRMFEKIGADTGFDCMAVTDSCDALYKLMDKFDSEDNLPRTILYSLNPADNEWIDTLLGAFQSSEIPGKIQHGSAWWFNDNKTGMEEQMKSLANLGIIGNFIGMLTDSRSFLSYTRHEYFRRILCNLIGNLVENGEYPDDKKYLGEMIENICYNNSKNYFNL